MFAIISVQHEDVMIMEKLDNETEVWSRKVSWAGLQPTLGKITQAICQPSPSLQTVIWIIIVRMPQSSNL